MLKNMTLTAVVRTVMQWGIGKLIALPVGAALIAFVVDELGWNIDEAFLVNGATALTIAGVVWLANKYGKKYPWINQILSWNLSRTGPGYVPNEADAVIVTANPSGTDTVRTVDTPPTVGPNEGTDDWPRG